MRKTAWIWFVGCVAWIVDGLVSMRARALPHAQLAFMVAMVFFAAGLRSGVPPKQPDNRLGYILIRRRDRPMPKTHIAKLFKNGASQAVRLPAEFRFEGEQVYISRDEKTQDVILSKRPGAGVWEDFFEFMKTVDIPEGWMKDRPMNRIPTKDRALFREDD